MSKKRWLTACVVALLLGLASAGQAQSQNLDRSVEPILVLDGDACVMETQLLVQALKSAPKKKTPASRAGKHLVKILQVDLGKGLVTAQILQTGEVVQFEIPPSTIKKAKLRSGQALGVGPLAAGARGRCKCGQKGDGSCWCTGERPCCGPLAGCPIGSCGKQQPIPNIKPEIMTP